MRLLHWQSNVNLKECNTFALSASSGWYARPDRMRSLIQDVRTAKELGLDIRILGQGSNVILQDFDGLTLTPALQGISMRTDHDCVRLKVAAGVDWPWLVRWCCENGYHGLENLAMIPGSAGAAPVQNIGAYGLEISERLVALDVLDIASGEVLQIPTAECGFCYRNSRFKEHPGSMIILALHLQLEYHLKPVLDYSEVAKLVSEFGGKTQVALYHAVCRLRAQKLPSLDEAAHAGSFFHNPSLSQKAFQKLRAKLPEVRGFPVSNGDQIRVPAAQLVAACGWRGRKLGAAAVSERHALIITNPGQARAADIYALAAAIQKDVADTFAIELQLEPTRL